MRNGKEYPSKQALALSKEYKLRYLISSDAHNPQDLVDEYVHKAEKWAEELGIEVMSQLSL